MAQVSWEVVSTQRWAYSRGRGPHVQGEGAETRMTLIQAHSDSVLRACPALWTPTDAPECGGGERSVGTHVRGPL